MKVLVNGIETQQTSVTSRGLLYGQSVFETIAIVSGKPRLLDLHLERLQQGCERLLIPIDLELLESEVWLSLVGLSDSENAVLRVTVMMDEGGRGYKNPDNPSSSRVLALHPYPVYVDHQEADGILLGLSDVQLATQPLLAGIKHSNRLEQVLARSRWQQNWHEALLLDDREDVVEATHSNVFIRKNGLMSTPSLDRCGVAGVMRAYVIGELKELGYLVQTVRLSVQEISEADEVFLSNSLIGVWSVREFQEKTYSDFSTANSLRERLRQDEVIPRY